MAGSDDNASDVEARLGRAFRAFFTRQALARVVSFALNAAVARQVGPGGAALLTVQYPLLLNSILYISREGFRKSCMRLGDPELDRRHPGTSHTSRVLSLAWLVVPLGLVWGLVLSACAVAWEGSLSWRPWVSPSALPSLSWTPFAAGVAMYYAAAVVELCAEPLHILALATGSFAPVIWCEVVGSLARSAAIVFVSRGGAGAHAVPVAVAAGLGQLAFGASVLAIHVAFRMTDLPCWVAAWWMGKVTAFRPRWALSMLASFGVQSAGKHVLAEGEKIVLLTVAPMPPADQGVYGLASNLGSLLVRMAFTPLEESAFLAFSSKCRAPKEPERARDVRSAVAAAADGNGASTSAQSAAGATEGGTGATGEAFGDDLGAALGLSSRLVGTLSLLATALGPPLCSLGVHVLYGAVWRNTDLPAVLAWYCWYLNVLAINGIAEAFLHATSSPRDLHWSNAALAVFSAAHLGVCALLVPALGVRGALLAGAINMAMRIAWSFSFVTRVYRGRQRAWLASALPSGRLLVSLGTAAAVLRISEWATAGHLATANGLSAPVAGLVEWLRASWLASTFSRSWLAARVVSRLGNASGAVLAHGAVAALVLPGTLWAVLADVRRARRAT